MRKVYTSREQSDGQIRGTDDVAAKVEDVLLLVVFSKC